MTKYLWTVLFAMSLVFVACGGDNGSSARDDEIDSSSSSAIQSSSSDVILSGGSSSEEESSSSVVKSSSSAKESSSSSEARSSSSSVKESSSSVKVSSSSGVIDTQAESSGDACIDIAEAQCQDSQSKSSSSVAKSSSSSVKISSSSEYVPFDHSIYLAPSMTVGPDRYKQFTDKRTGRSYYYITITGKDTSYKANSVTVMAENLNIGEMIEGFDDQSDDSKIERYCYKDDTTNCDKYGGLYQWAEMMALPSRCNTESCADLIQENHQGICPEGWRLLTYNDMYTIVHADGNEDGIKGVRSVPFGGFNSTGYSLVGAGYLWNFAFDGMNSSTYWHYPVERTEKRSNASWATNSSTDFQVASTNKTNGLSVRCVKLDEN